MNEQEFEQPEVEEEVFGNFDFGEFYFDLDFGI